MNPRLASTRRHFVQSVATAGAALAVATTFAQEKQPAAPKDAKKIKLGYDNFAMRAFNWKASQLIDYAAKIAVDSLFISDLDAFESLEEKPLAELKAKADNNGLDLHVGTWSICPTSTRFRNNRGSAEEHLKLGIRVAKSLGSPVIRVILGSREDRLTEGGIDARIADTVKVCKACKSQAVDAGVKIAVENHAGDMRAEELVALIEAAGKDYVGANIDSGNAAWALEDPLDNLEKLGPYVATTSLRDTSIWESKNGVTMQWRAMGEGTIGQKRYFQRFAELCPGIPVHIETIGGFNHAAAYLKPDFWKSYPNLKAADFSRFLAIAKGQEPLEPYKKPAGVDSKIADQEFQQGELERSIKYCKEVLGLGVK
jgi:sugar phosphate isomerase/epimerase